MSKWPPEATYTTEQMSPHTSAFNSGNGGKKHGSLWGST